jgi:sulfate-transporting ATPase
MSSAASPMPALLATMMPPRGPRRVLWVVLVTSVSKIVPPKRQIIKDISLSFFPGAKIGLLGLNGSGKSTVLRIMAGVDKEFDGEVQRLAGISIGYLPQEPQLDPAKTVREEVESALGEVMQAQAKLDEVYAAYADPTPISTSWPKEQARLEAIIATAGSDTENQMELAADALRLPPWDAVIGNLSGGEKRRVALCKLLLSKPDMLLLDEPTNHLDAESVEWLEQFLVRFPGTVVAVTHDRYFLDNAAEWILELDRGHGIPWKGNYSELAGAEGSPPGNRKQADRRPHEGDEAGTGMGAAEPERRQAKSKARLARFEELSSVEYQKRNETQEIFIPVGERLGDKVIEFNGVTKSFGDKLLMDNLSFTIPPGAIVGIIGPNGAGKSTLFKMITGQQQPDSGEVDIGPTVKLAYVDQSATASTATRPCSRKWPAAATSCRSASSNAVARLHRPLQLQGRRPAEAGRQPVRRRTRPPASGQDADRRRQRAAARRTVQRPRRRNPARAGRRAARIPRLRDGHLARPLVPRPHLHAHPGLRRRLAVDLLHRQLPGIRGRQEALQRLIAHINGAHPDVPVILGKRGDIGSSATRSTGTVDRTHRDSR